MKNLKSLRVHQGFIIVTSCVFLHDGFSQVPLLVQDRHRGRHGRGKDNALGRRGGFVAPPRVKRQQCWDQFSSKVRVDNNKEELSCVRMSAVVHLFHLSFVFVSCMALLLPVNVQVVRGGRPHVPCSVLGLPWGRAVYETDVAVLRRGGWGNFRVYVVRWCALLCPRPAATCMLYEGCSSVQRARARLTLPARPALLLFARCTRS